MKAFLVLAMILVVAAAHAVPVDPDAPGGLAAIWMPDGNCYILTVEGKTWTCPASGGEWTLFADSLPVPIEEIADWTNYFILTHSGDLYG